MQKSPVKKYIRAKIKEKKIKVSYFLTPMGFLDQFHLIGTVYAQSGGGGDGGYGGGGATSNTSGGGTGGAGTGSSTGGTSGTNSGTGGN